MVLMLVSLIFLFLGFFSPQKSLFWYKKEKTKKTSALIYGIAFIVFFILVGINANKSESNNAATKDTSEQTEQKPPSSKGTGVGEVLKTQYFDIIVNKVTVNDRVNTGNEFADLKPEQGNKYLIINASFKNTDNESRMLLDGSVWITYNGKEYEYDKSETVMLEGWGLLLDQINPLTTKTTNLVYKIPAEITGPAFWQPGRADSDERIFLGTFQ